jgi:hypothetical protein
MNIRDIHIRDPFLDKLAASAFDDEELKLLRTLNSDYKGGTYEQGLAIGKAIIRKTTDGLPVRPIIIEGQEVSTLQKRTIVALDTDLNFGLLNALGMPCEALGSVTSETTSLALGATGLKAGFEPVWRQDEYTEQDVEGIIRTFGVGVMPATPALRAQLI